MSLDQALNALITAIQANTAALHAHQQAAPATVQQAPPQQQPAWTPPQAAPQPPANGMPAPPNYGPPTVVPQVQQAAPPPFASQQDLYDYCTHVYQSNNAMGPRMEAILKQMTPGGEASQIQTHQYGQFFAAVEAARQSA